MSPDSAQPAPPSEARLPQRPEAPEPAAPPPPEAAPPPAAAAPPVGRPVERPAEPPALPAGPVPTSRVVRSRLRRVILVGGTLVGLVAAWEILTYFVAYTDDAYVRSDLVGVAPQVTGPIV